MNTGETEGQKGNGKMMQLYFKKGKSKKIISLVKILIKSFYMYECVVE